MILSGEAPSTSMSWSWTALMTCWPGVRLWVEHFPAQAFAHRVEERAHDAEFDVGFEERRADVGEGLVEVGVAQATSRAQRGARGVRDGHSGRQTCVTRLP